MSLWNLKSIALTYGGAKAVKEVEEWIDENLIEIGYQYELTYEFLNHIKDDKDSEKRAREHYENKCLYELGKSLKPYCNIVTYPSDLTKDEYLSGVSSRYRNNFGSEKTQYKILVYKK